MELIVISGIIVFTISCVSILINTLNSKPYFKKGDLLVPNDIEVWDQNVIIEVLEVGKNKYRLKTVGVVSTEFDKYIDEIDCRYSKHGA